MYHNLQEHVPQIEVHNPYPYEAVARTTTTATVEKILEPKTTCYFHPHVLGKSEWNNPRTDTTPGDINPNYVQVR